MDSDCQYLDTILTVILYGSYLVYPLFIYWAYKLIRTGKLIYYVLVFLCLLFTWARFIEPNLLVVKNYNFNLQAKEEVIKIAVAGDLHLGIFSDQKKLAKVVDKINRLEPDLVLIPGDLVFRLSPEDFSEFKVLKGIKAPLALVLGNHDHGQPEGVDVSAELTASLESYDLEVLDNKVKIFQIKGREVKVVGLSDYYNGDSDLTLLKKDNPDQLVFALTHNPDLIYSYPETARVDLTVAGHTHGGQIRLPWIYKTIIPSDYGFNVGEYLINNFKLLISSGVGMVGLPMRLWRLPEIAVLEVK